MEIIPETIPALALPDEFQTVALPKLDEIHLRVEKTFEQAKGLQIIDEQSRIAAGILTQAFKNDAKNAQAVMTPYKTVADRVVEFIRTKTQRTTNRCEMGKTVLAPKMAEWDRKEAERARREQAEAQAKTDKENERQAKAELKAGNIGRQEFKDRVANPPTVVVKPNIPKVAGNVRRTNYSAECTNVPGFVMKLLQAWQKDKATFNMLLSMIEVSKDRLSAEARRVIKTRPADSKELTVAQFETRWPFVTVKEEHTY